MKPSPTLSRWITAATLAAALLLAVLLQVQAQTEPPDSPYLPWINAGPTLTHTLAAPGTATIHPTITPSRMPSITATFTQTATVTPTRTATRTPTATRTGAATLPFSGKLFLPVLVKHAEGPPLYSTSYYIQNEDPALLWDLGCELGQRDLSLPGKQDSLVVLNFGQMWTDDNGVKGVGSFYPYWHEMPLSDVEVAVRGYMQGYWACSGADQVSQVIVAVGTNNYGRMNSGYETSQQNELRAVAYDYGQRWADLVASLTQYAINQGYIGQIQVAGAIDIEWGTGWSTPHVTKGWVEGFSANDQDYYIYYNFGACIGCPIVPNPNWVYSSASPWTQDEVWYVSWGAAPAWPLPEIYRNDGYLAKQWQAVSKYGALYRGRKIDFVGPMTQWQACQTRDESECLTLDNTPEEGWLQLFTELNRDPLTAQSGLRWVTDIDWQIR